MDSSVKTPDANYAVTCYLGPAHDLYHLSNVVTGLAELAVAGSVDLRFGPVDADSRKPLESAAMRVTVGRAGRVIDVVFDLYDRADHFEMPLLEDCDVYFKRSFHPPARTKVVPFGLNFACRSASGEALLAAARLPLSDSLNRYRTVRSIEDFEQDAASEMRPSILFQTRAWPPGSTTDDTEAINESRVRIIEALRNAFPSRFYGGFAPTAFARERYLHLITTSPSTPPEYLAFSKQHLVGVSSRGLHGSVPFKIAEYVAASLAIVSERLNCELPTAFVDGRDFLAFRTPDECVERCERILNSPTLAAELRRASRRYYLSELQPPSHMQALLQRAFEVCG